MLRCVYTRTARNLHASLFLKRALYNRHKLLEPETEEDSFVSSFQNAGSVSESDFADNLKKKTHIFLNKKNNGIKKENAELNSFCDAGLIRFQKAMKKVLQNAAPHLFEALQQRKEITAFSQDENKELITLAETVIQGSLLLGYFHAMPEKRKNDFADDEHITLSGAFGVEALPFEEAVQFLKSKIPMEKTEWLELERKLQFRAFTVAKLSEADYIEAIKRRLAKAIEKGETVWQSWSGVEAMTEEWGEKFSARYWETVYRTNVQSAYNAGRLMQYKNNPPNAWELLFIEDNRQSDVCKGLSGIAGGKALPSKHSFWDTYGFPPYHFNCRTTFRAVYDNESEAETPRSNPAMEEIEKHFKPQKGFGGNPLEKMSWWKLSPEMISRADKYGITADIVAQARELDMQSYFPELLQGYKTTYKGKKGGYVQTALNAEHNPEEIASAKRLADSGHQVYLLPRSGSVSSPDMIIDNEIGEIKGFGFDKKYQYTTKGTMQTEIKKAGQKQRARILYLDVAEHIDIQTVYNALVSEIWRTPINKIIISYKGNETIHQRKEFLKKK